MMGFGILEAIVAIFLLAAAVVGVLGIFPAASQYQHESRTQAEAAHIARAAIEQEIYLCRQAVNASPYLPTATPVVTATVAGTTTTVTAYNPTPGPVSVPTPTPAVSPQSMRYGTSETLQYIYSIYATPDTLYTDKQFTDAYGDAVSSTSRSLWDISCTVTWNEVGATKQKIPKSLTVTTVAEMDP
jgi:type II secretory pathway pseudopilin PulG